MPDFLTPTLIYGAIYSTVVALMLLLLGWINPEMWLDDYPPDIRARYGPMSAEVKRQRLMYGVPFMVFMIGFPIFAVFQFAQTLTYWQVFGSLLLMYTFFNLVDLLVLDWLIFNTIQPRFIILPGTEGMAGYKDYGFHFRGSLKGQIGLTIASLILAGIVTVFM
jgi:hypothetical protein